MKVNIIKGKNGCRELDINLEDINGVTSNKEIRNLYIKNRKYRLTSDSHKMLLNKLRSSADYTKCIV